MPAPKLKPQIKCASWCGRGCTQKEFDIAQADAYALGLRLGHGWKSRTSENLGWHVSAESPCGRLKVHQNTRKSYTAFLGRAGEPGGTWAASATTPEAAIRAVIVEAREALASYQEITAGLIEEWKPRLPARRPRART